MTVALIGLGTRQTCRVHHTNPSNFVFYSGGFGVQCSTPGLNKNFFLSVVVLYLFTKYPSALFCFVLAICSSIGHVRRSAT